MSANTFAKRFADKIGYRADDNDIYEKRLALANILEPFESLPMLIVSGFLQKSIGGMFFNGAMAFFGIVLAWILPANTAFNILLLCFILSVFKAIFSVKAVDRAVNDMLKGVQNLEIIYEKILKRVAKHIVCITNVFKGLSSQNQLCFMIIMTFFAFFIPLPVFVTIGLLIVALFPVYNIVSKQEAERFLASPPVSPRVRSNKGGGIRGVPDSLVNSLRSDQNDVLSDADAVAQLTSSLAPPPPPPPPPPQIVE